MIVYIRDPKNSTRELLNLINSFSAIAEYKINSNKSMPFLYTKDKRDEKEIRETTPFTIASKSSRIVIMCNPDVPWNDSHCRSLRFRPFIWLVLFHYL
jgi:ribosome biogenesis protein Nip4